MSAVLLALFFFELYSYIKDIHDFRAVKFSGTYVDNPNVSGDKKILGYGPKEDTSFQVTAIRKNNDSVIFNVVFSFKNGKRYTPEVNDTAQEYCVFLGCSHVFGDGLNDNQTLPYFFNLYTHRKFNVINMAFNGYGPHQALKITEEILLKNQGVLDGKKGTVIYSFIPSHFIRAGGKVPWDQKGPWYEVENDSLVFKGSFADKHSPDNFFTLRWKIIWQNSNLYKSFFYPDTEDKDVERTIKIVEKMATHFSEKGIKFIVLITTFKKDSENVITFIDNLKKSGISYFLLDSIILDIKTNHDLYFIKGDGHPNELHNKKIAEFLAKQITQ